MIQLNSLAIFCGSNLGREPEYLKIAYQLGEYLAHQRIKLIFGGGKIGLMGVVSQAVIKSNGQALGIVPEFLMHQEMSYNHEIEMQVVENMAVRKDRMIELSDGFVILPGGIGTYEEVFEVLSRLQLRQINKPIGFLNINHFFDTFVALMQNMADAGFIPQENMQLFCIDTEIDRLIEKLSYFTMPYFNKKIHTKVDLNNLKDN